MTYETNIEEEEEETNTSERTVILDGDDTKEEIIDTQGLSTYSTSSTEENQESHRRPFVSPIPERERKKILKITEDQKKQFP